MRLKAGTREDVDLSTIASTERSATSILILWQGDANERVREIIDGMEPCYRDHLCAVYAHDDVMELLWDSFGPPAAYAEEIEV